MISINKIVYKIVLLSFMTTLCFSDVTCEVFSSVAKMGNMVYQIQHDLTISNYLKPMMQKLDNYEKDLKGLIFQLEDLSSGIKKPDFDPKHPLNAYRFIRNHSIVYNETAESILAVVDKIGNVKINKTLQTVLKRLPTIEDLEGLMEGIYRLQMTYNLDTADIAQGRVNGLTAPPLSALECVEMADLCARRKNLYRAREWMQQAIRLVTKKKDSTLPTADVYHRMMAYAFVAGEMETAARYCEEVIRHTPKSKRRRMKKILRHIHYEIDNDLQQGEGWTLPKKTPKKTKYDALCQGLVQQFEDPARKAALSTLKCRYKKSRNSFYKYQRIKMEERSRDPYVVLYHDVFRSPELERLRRLALPKLKRSTVIDRDTGNRKSSKSRVSQGMFLKGDLRKNATAIVKRIEAVTGLWSGEVSYESLQVSNYGFGGMYNEHHDAFPQSYFKKKSLPNQRMATFMIYLTDVAAGGATVFPSIPEAVFPKAGNAIFWYNTYRNGTEDRRVGHGGCPVIVGDKWLANQWIRSWGQEFSRPCGLNKIQ